MISIRWIFALALFAQSALAYAQGPYFTCVNFNGTKVAQVMDSTIPDGAMAFPHQAVIRFNPAAMNNMPPVVRDFVYAHECAHHALGHTVIKPNSEPEADCWAIKMLVFKFGLPPEGVNQIQAFFYPLASTAAHPPGHVRAMAIGNCAKIPPQ